MAISNQTLAFDATVLGAELSRFRAACVRAENAATPFARKTLAGLMTDAITPAYIGQALLALFRPVTPAGKKGATLSSLRYAVGGDAARKTADTIFRVYQNRDVSSECRETILAFILEEDGCARSLNALHNRVKDLVAARAEVDNLTNAAATVSATPEACSMPPCDIAAMADHLIRTLDSADVATLRPVQDRLTALSKAIADARKRLAGKDRS